MNGFLSRWLRRPAPRRTGGAAALRAAALAELSAACAAAEAADDEERPRGCGWFDSSHDLRRGLWVCEQPDVDAVAATLPLEPWLALHLAGWQPRAPG